MIKIIGNMYDPVFLEYGFTPEENNGRFCSVGHCWKAPKQIGSGFYWIYMQKDLFNIKIHDFFFYEDFFMEFDFQERMSVTYYESISGEELAPYRRLSAGCVKSFLGGGEPYKALIDKKIPIRCIGVEIMPAYYEDYLRQTYPGEYIVPVEAFQNIDQTTDFPEMVRLLYQVKNYRGEGMAAKLFYEAKVAEAVSLVVERWKKSKPLKKTKLSTQDCKQLQVLTAYINDHYTFELPLDKLARIACTGTTKLKNAFKQYHGCTITEYIQHRRMAQAESLLSETDLKIGQVAQTVGYTNSSRFAELFKKSTGLLPGEYRRISKQ